MLRWVCNMGRDDRINSRSNVPYMYDLYDNQCAEWRRGVFIKIYFEAAQESSTRVRRKPYQSGFELKWEWVNVRLHPSFYILFG